MQSPNPFRVAIAVVAFALIVLSAHSVSAQQYTAQNVHTFPEWYDLSSRSGDASGPGSPMVQAADGTLYGSTSFGGLNGEGAIYAYKNGVESLVYYFDTLAGNGENASGASPQTAPVIESDGSLYGATEFGGELGDGTIYRFANGQFSTLHAFAGGAGATYLTIGPGGVVYEVSEAGSANAYAELFKLQNGTFTDLYDFNGTNGQAAGSSAAPTVAADGTIYGTTVNGGAYSGGSIWKFANGAMTTLYSFGRPDSQHNTQDGSAPNSKLVLAADGTLYGTTQWGVGGSGYGTVFSFKDGVLTTLHNFAGAPDGNLPRGGLTLAPDGTLYGTTQYGGANSIGAVYSYKSGVYRFLYSCDAYTDPSKQINANGANPAGVTLGSDGALYVAASTGGTPGNGTIIKLSSSSWTERSVAAAASGETRMLWTQPSGAASIWSVAASGHITYGPAVGPFSGWTPRSITIGANGNTYLWWTNTNGSMSFWIFNSSGVAIWQGSAVGPYAGWTPVDFSANADGTERVLWTETSGQASVWTIAVNDTITFSPTFGPYTGWSAEHLVSGPSGSTRLLWNTAQGAASVWTVASSGTVSYSPTYGPYTGWNCVNIGLASDSKTRMQWNNGASTSFWTVPSSGPVAYSQVWGPFAPWNPGDFSVAADGSVRLLWLTPSGQASFWSVGTGGGVSYSATYGPY